MHKVCLVLPIWFTRPLSIDEQNELVDKLYQLMGKAVTPGGYLELPDVEAVDFDIEIQPEE